VRELPERGNCCPARLLQLDRRDLEALRNALATLADMAKGGGKFLIGLEANGLSRALRDEK